MLHNVIFLNLQILLNIYCLLILHDSTKVPENGITANNTHRQFKIILKHLMRFSHFETNFTFYGTEFIRKHSIVMLHDRV